MTKFSETKILDWRNAEDYNYLTDLDAKGWAWEFLRRTKEYRSDYNECYEEVRKLKATHGNAWATQFIEYDPPLQFGETERDWQLRAHDPLKKSPRRLNVSHKAADKWGLWKMYSPNRLYDKHIRFLATELPKVIERPEDFDLLYDYRDSDEGDGGIILPNYVLAFDLSKSIDVQLATAKDLLSKKRVESGIEVNKASKIGKKPVTHWPQYIRVLDAWNAGADRIPAAKIIFPKKANSADLNSAYGITFDDALAAAKRLGRDYKIILSHFSLE